MAKKKKVSILSVILLCVALVGVVLAIVGVAIDWFSVKGLTKTEGSGLFADGLADLGKLAEAVPIAAVQAFALLTLILGALGCVCILLKVLGALKLKFLIRLIFVALVVACAVIALALGLSFANKVKADGAAGIYLLFVGGILAGAPLLLAKD